MLANENTNVFSDSVVFNMECTRNSLRRLARGDEAEFSNQSIFCAMDKFVKAVQDMDETILVPSRLLDLKVGDATDSVQPQTDIKAHKIVPSAKRRNGDNFRDAMHAADLYSLYTMVNSVKNELLWGRNASPPEDVEETTRTTTTSTTTTSTTTSLSGKGHVRRPSTVSVTSTHSATSVISDTDSETGNENDSGIEGEESPKPDCTQQVAQNFRRHLHGLYRSLEQMTETAHYLTTRYQNDVGDAV